MNTFRFVLYTWLCTVVAYPPLVLLFDVLTRSNTEGRLFFPLLAGAFVLGIPGLLLGWLSLSLLQVRRLPLLVQYCLWTGAVLLLIYLTLTVLGGPRLLDIHGELARFVLPLFGAAMLVLLLRYPYFREIPLNEY
ncbi:hypothetical protein [Flaviaesturariibacter aridisoli]|uniref:Uncharacterized protein n=1 Tax=Flaviaesturariibacter aridisoli TaxID=2545761 RepID=A0A4R4E4A4_9BACT|nr:hypothetical protein [Flaviaesturariibacter aridisoli]TCZ73530.1 hypothetical protein E0486_06090 [Flaviaesturariibacter aridisoli]